MVGNGVQNAWCIQPLICQQRLTASRIGNGWRTISSLCLMAIGFDKSWASPSLFWAAGFIIKCVFTQFII